jgi:hypothetical protein
MAGSLLNKIFWGGLYVLQGLLLWPVRRKPLVHSFASEGNIPSLIDHYRRELKSRGGRCYIIGRGPSLDRFASCASGEGLRLCINAAHTAINKPDLVFFHDDHMLASVATVLASGAKLVLPIDINLTSGGRMLVKEFIRQKNKSDCFFYRCQKFSPFLSNETDNYSLLTMSGTAHSAISFAKKIGAKDICFIGIDGGTAQGKDFSDKFEQRKCSLRQRLIYRKIRFDCVVLCRYLGMGYRFL